MGRHSSAIAAVCALALGFGTVGCASGSAAAGRPSPFPGAPEPTWTSRGRLPASAPAAAVLNAALALEGTRYRFGGADPRTGFDCSGLVWYVFMTQGVPLPRTTAEQYQVGRAIELPAVEPGDLVFFSTTEPGPSHVGIALDRDTLIHAPSTGTVVRIERFDTPYWRSRLTGVRRVDEAQAVYR